MASSVQMLLHIAPEFEGEDQQRLESFIEMAALRLSPRIFGRLYPQAVAYLAAHLLSVSGRAREAGRTAAGPLASITTGGQSISFAQSGALASLGDEALKSTSYGLEFLAIRNSRAGTKMKLIRP